MNPFTNLPRRKPVRRKRSKPRRGPWRSREYRRHIAMEVYCCVGELCGSESCSKFIACNDAAHTQNNGMSSKGPDSSCVPLCRKHHLEYDRGRKAFERKYGLDLQALAKQYFERWLAEGNGTEV